MMISRLGMVLGSGAFLVIAVGIGYLLPRPLIETVPVTMTPKFSSQDPIIKRPNLPVQVILMPVGDFD